MKRCYELFFAVVLVLILCACGSKSTAVPAETSNQAVVSETTATEAVAKENVSNEDSVQVKAENTPEEIVKSYFEAVRYGDIKTAIACFTPDIQAEWEATTSLVDSVAGKAIGFSNISTLLSGMMAFINTDYYQDYTFTVTDTQYTSNTSAMVKVGVQMGDSGKQDTAINCALVNNKWYIEQGVDKSVADNIQNNQYAFKSLQTPFYNGAAWAEVYDSSNRVQTVVINDNFEITYIIDNEKYPREYGYTTFENGYAAIYPHGGNWRDAGFIIIDPNGNVVYEVLEEEKQYLCGVIEDSFFVAKNESGFSGDIWKLFSLDADMQLHDMNLEVDDHIKWADGEIIELADGIYMLGTKVINVKDGVYLQPNTTAWVEVVGDYLAYGGDVLPYSYVTEAREPQDINTNYGRYEEMSLSNVNDISKKIREHYEYGSSGFFGDLYFTDWQGGSWFFMDSQVKTIAGYCDLDGNVIFEFPKLPEGASYRKICADEDGKWTVYMIGADGNGYVSIVDETGSMLYEPVQVGGLNGLSNFLDECTSHKGYAIVSGDIVTPEGEKLKIGDDLSALDSEVPYTFDYPEIVISNGYIYYRYKDVNTLVSLDGTKTIDTLFLRQESYSE